MRRSYFLHTFSSAEARTNLVREILGDSEIKSRDLIQTWERKEKGVSHLNLLLRDGRLVLIMEAKHQIKNVNEMMAFELADLAIQIHENYNGIALKPSCCMICEK